MIANYGYQDGSGDYYITIDTGRCIDCAGRWCVQACPQRLFVIEVDDYDDEVAAIAVAGRRRLKEECAGCKPVGGYDSLPCVTACVPAALSHSW
jgi:Fe-S-cluster-containing hydrogenase component 2